MHSLCEFSSDVKYSQLKFRIMVSDGSSELKKNNHIELLRKKIVQEIDDNVATNSMKLKTKGD